MRMTKAHARSPQAAATADQPHIRDGVVGRATRAGHDPCRAVAGEARDAVDTRGVDRFRQDHVWDARGHTPLRMIYLIKASEEPGRGGPMPSLVLYEANTAVMTMHHT